MTKTKALERLNTLLIELQELPNYIYDSENKEFTKWEMRAWRYIEDIFKDSDRGHMSSFQGIEFEYYQNTYFNDGPNPSYYIQVHNKARKEAETLIESFIEEVNEWEDAEISSDNPEVVKLKLLINEAETLKTSNFKRYEANPEFDKWVRRVGRGIGKLSGTISKTSNNFGRINFKYTGPRGMDGVEVPLDVKTYQNGIIETISLLESLIEELEEGVYDLIVQDNIIVQETDKTKVFIVHGHDGEAKQEVARFIEKFGLEAIILHEKASSSKTIIEKIEAYTTNIGFGIILYTACDIGGKDTDSLNSRARQNVVFEHGYLIGKLGRENVCSLVKGEIETPGDISGVVYMSMNGESWHLPLVKELEASGYNIDRDLL